MVRAVIRALIVAALSGALVAADWSAELAVPGEAMIELPAEALIDADAVRFDLSGWADGERRAAWLEPTLVVADGRAFAAAEAIRIEAGEHLVPLTPSAWVGARAPLGGDALLAIHGVRLRAYGGDGQRLTVRVGLDRAKRGTPRFAVALCDGGLVERPAWRELRLRLVGDVRGERGEIDLAGDDGRRIPMFLEQPGEIVAGAWRARGACRWVARLRAGEDVSGLRPRWRGGVATWDGPSLPTLAVTAREPAPAACAAPFASPEAPAWRGRATVVAGEGRFARQDVADYPACPAPVLAWLVGWTGYRGGRACAHAQAAALDGQLAAGVAELDLMPQALFHDQGTFRFGLTPWHADHGGAWSQPQDALAHDAPLATWRAHARWVVARARAAPGLARWRIGLIQPANAPGEVERLRSLIADLAALVQVGDGRPLVAFHPQAADFGHVDPKGVWFDFEQGAQGWRTGLTPLDGVDGGVDAGSLRVPLDVGAGIGGAFVMADANVFNLDRIEFDARCDGGGAATVYAWCTDDRHRWYQQRLGDVASNDRWQCLGIDFSDAAPFTPSGHAQPWDGSQRRRIRLIGVMAFAYGGGVAKSLRIDRVRRLGWPALVGDPTLALTESAVSGDVARWRPFACDFALSLAAVNPYDPESADVVGELEGPDGLRLRHPAYWSEPHRLEMVDGVERAVGDGGGAWHWRFTAPKPGAWRWRIVARVKWRDRWLETAGAWHDATVAAAGDGALVPIRTAQADPRWFETVDGAFWYPLGLNLRSPGDARQDGVVASAGPRPGEPANTADFERLGTRAYERWFARMHAAGADFARVWMCPWWCGLEWRRDWDGYGGVGVYNQAAAARLDRVLELAGQHEVRVQLELQNHGMYSTRVDAQWADNPYSRRRGGMCGDAADFFVQEDAWATHEKRLRYTLARWGWATPAAMWVLSSEIEFTEGWFREAGFDEDAGRSRIIEAWLKRSAAWFAANDPLARPVSVHFSHPWTGGKVWEMPEMRWGYSNAYTGFQDEMKRLGAPGGLDVALEHYLVRHFPPWKHQRPTLIGEWGGHWDQNTHARLAGEWHAGLWMQAVLPYAGNTGFWWWLWVDSADRWSELAGIARFVRGFDPRGGDWRPSRPKLMHADVVMVGMRSPREHRYYAHARGFDRDPAARFGRDAGPADISVGEPGSTWTVERWDCQKGEAIATSVVTVDERGHLILPLGEIAQDAAWIIRRK